MDEDSAEFWVEVASCGIFLLCPERIVWIFAFDSSLDSSFNNCDIYFTDFTDFTDFTEFTEFHFRLASISSLQ